MKILNSPFIVAGGQFQDERGILKFVNEFDFANIKRFYLIYGKQNTVRAWQGHKHEIKAFYPIKGSFKIFAVKIDDWHAPSSNLKASEYGLNEAKSQILIIPGGYANGILVEENESILLVFSSHTLQESQNDLVRFDRDLWVNWEQIIKRKQH